MSEGIIKVSNCDVTVKQTKELEKSIASDLKKPDKKLRDVLPKPLRETNEELTDDK
jgi:hypothetical protein